MRLRLERGSSNRALDRNGKQWRRLATGYWVPAGANSVGTGEQAHAWAAAISAAVESEQVTIRVRHELADHQLRLMATMGVRVVVDPAAPRCVGKCPVCGEGTLGVYRNGARPDPSIVARPRSRSAASTPS
jgi:hypothetical protein